jgi:lipopolysaccharide/colanic/teichoic acid biosynthesis glycosyltransferase
MGFLKRAFDSAVSVLALILLAPMFALIALGIWLDDRGPVFYWQIRIGLGGRRFAILKFRTMRENAEEYLGAVESVPDDPRCTRLGWWLRRYGIDDLPQLWNILRGDMSIVGPRPERPEFIREFRKKYPHYDIRHHVRGGILGHAQAHGWRRDVSVGETLKHDIYYVRNWSLWLDLRILGLSLWRGWSARLG